MEKYTVHYSSSKRDTTTGKNGSNSNGFGGDKKGSGNNLVDQSGKKSNSDGGTPVLRNQRVNYARDGDFYRAVLAVRRGDPMAALQGT